MSDIRRRIIIVDDNIANLTVGRNLLKSDYDVYLAPSAAQMFEMLEKIMPDLILLDIEMPDMDGYAAISKLKAYHRFAHIPVIFLTAQSAEESELKGLDMGAADYISKPFSPPLLLKRIEHQLRLVQQQETIQSHANNLSLMVSEKVGEIISLQNAILGTVADLVEFRDTFTGGHTARTQLYLKAMTDGLKRNPLYRDAVADWDMAYVLRSAQLHDVGKIAIPDAILNKPGRLTPEEFDIMKTHVPVGIDAVSKMIRKTKDQAFLRHTLNIVGAHHEKWDGTGYPYDLRGEDIPLEGRLMAVADVYDALVSQRPYKEKMSHEQAKKIIRDSRGTHFDPDIVDVFLGAENVFERISSDDTLCGDDSWGAIVFTKDMETGDTLLDIQHKELIDRLNWVMFMGQSPVSKKVTQKTLDIVDHYIARHFADEESLQTSSGYPKCAWHKSQHQLFTAGYQQLKEEFAHHGFSAELSMKLNHSIAHWIVQHIKSADVEFGKYHQLRMPLGGADERRGA